MARSSLSYFHAEYKPILPFVILCKKLFFIIFLFHIRFMLTAMDA